MRILLSEALRFSPESFRAWIRSAVLGVMEWRTVADYAFGQLEEASYIQSQELALLWWEVLSETHAHLMGSSKLHGASLIRELMFARSLLIDQWGHKGEDPFDLAVLEQWFLDDLPQVPVSQLPKAAVKVDAVRPLVEHQLFQKHDLISQWVLLYPEFDLL